MKTMRGMSAVVLVAWAGVPVGSAYLLLLVEEVAPRRLRPFRPCKSLPRP
mgnify:CR=1 FL=1